MRIKRNCFLLIIILFIFLIKNSRLQGQNADRNIDSFSIKNYQEYLFIDTDREIYITGEQVWLKVFKMDGLSGALSDISKIVYIELLDVFNNPVIQVKTRIDGTSGSAVIWLSDTLSSGNYLLRAYTNWMKNFSEDLFSYRTITIVNPFKNIGDLVTPVSGQINDDIRFYTEGEDLTGDKAISNQEIVKTNLNKKKYQTRDKVKLDISVFGAAGNPVNADLSVSVVKSFLADTFRKYQTERSGIANFINYSFEIPSYLPELEGELISGVILNKATNEPLRETDISLSFVGKTAKCQFMKTNTKGEFIFVVKDRAGLDEIVIQPLRNDITGSYVELNLPFCNTFNGNRPAPFILDSNKVESINNAVISMQVNNIYEQARDQSDSLATVQMHDFFGKPSRRVIMTDFIELTDIREVVKEILPEVTLLRKERVPALKVISSSPYRIFENQALVLFDGVPVYDIEKLLDISSRELERIDIINTRYFYSDYVFEGILSFVSKKGNLSAIESDNSVFRQIFEGCLDQKNFYSPDYSTDSLRSGRIPDFRNTLYWKPDVITSESGTASIEFFTSDEGMEYIIIVEGFTSGGQRVYYTTPLIVE
ncbi:MAG: hypothetical protein MUO72_16425 [Bacteroidales bacterium]|nr:hypothetical protein [Bacteroidales bacterium]